MSAALRLPSPAPFLSSLMMSTEKLHSTKGKEALHSESKTTSLYYCKNAREKWVYRCGGVLACLATWESHKAFSSIVHPIIDLGQRSCSVGLWMGAHLKPQPIVDHLKYLRNQVLQITDKNNKLLKGKTPKHTTSICDGCWVQMGQRINKHV